MPMSPASKVLETKVVILGHTGVGKTSMLNQFVRGSFTGQSTATIGAAFMKKTIVINDWQIILQIWDTAGQERFRSMAPMYYRGAHAAVLVFDVTSADTLDKVGGWAEELSGHANEDMVLVLAANKADLLNNAATTAAAAAQQPPTASPASSVSSASSTPSSSSSSSSLSTPPSSSVYPSSLQSSAQQYAASIHAAYFETSAKTGAGIESLFRHVASTLLKAHLDKERREGRGAAAAGDHARGGAAAAGAGGAGRRKLSLQAREQGEMDSAGCC